MLPELLLFGEAGSGKDSVASFLVENHGAVALAMADPMKRLAHEVFGFTEDQLWGPSANRNAMDPRFTETRLDPDKAWERAEDLVNAHGGLVWYWIKDLLGGDHDSRMLAHEKLKTWFSNLKALALLQGGLSPRTMLQTLGTEWGRFVDRRVWIRYAQMTQRALMGGGYKYSRLKGLIDAPGQQYQWAVVTDGRFRNEALEFKAGGATIIRVTNPESGALNAGVAGHASESEQKTIPDAWFDYVIRNGKVDGLEALKSLVDSMARYFETSYGLYATWNFK